MSDSLFETISKVVDSRKKLTNQALEILKPECNDIIVKVLKTNGLRELFNCSKFSSSSK